MVQENDDSVFSISLADIAEWQLSDSQVGLPELQRGFIWKVNQIESLWDSIFRGFPIGSFLMSADNSNKKFIIDGQQRATSIALGFYNPWVKKETSFWQLKSNIPIIWIDVDPIAYSLTQKYVFRVVTKSHPWGYQCQENNKILSVSDRKKALSIFKENQNNREKLYTKLNSSLVFPYDCNIPIPLSFVIEATKESFWKGKLLELCKKHLAVDYIKTKQLKNTDYITTLQESLNNTSVVSHLLKGIDNLNKFYVPGIVVKNEIIKAEDEGTGKDPTLFVRLNSSGTRIAGDDLIYSIYKATFPEAKLLVENIGANYLSPSLVISLISRLVYSQSNNGVYPRPFTVNDFIKNIKDESFKNNLKQMIGNETTSPAKILFDKAIDILLSKNNLEIPVVLVKDLIKNSPDLFLMLLQWRKQISHHPNLDIQKKIVASLTLLAWFGKDNKRFVREIWEYTSLEGFWNKEIFQKSWNGNRDYIFYPLLEPDTLKNYLLNSVVENQITWDKLYPTNNDILEEYKKKIDIENVSEIEFQSIVTNIWESFITKLYWNKQLILFAQRKYINQSFNEFNQLENLEDTNTPWDWDHIYPSSWIYGKWNIEPNTRHWSNSIGNLRALSLEDNRSEGDNLSPKERLEFAKELSFINENDWEFWSKIENRIIPGNREMIKNHLKAIIIRLYNLYKEWFDTLEIKKLFN